MKISMLVLVHDTVIVSVAPQTGATWLSLISNESELD
jgi:hypothetical protein